MYKLKGLSVMARQLLGNWICKMRSGKIPYIHFVLIFILATACNSGSKKTGKASVPPPNEDYFQEIGKEIGLDFVHSIGGPELNNIIESSCGGTAFLDYNQDGFIDIFVCNGTWIEGFTRSEKPDILPVNHLYRNLGNGTFEDVTEKANVSGPWYCMGVAAGDLIMMVILICISAITELTFF